MPLPSTKILSDALLEFIRIHTVNLTKNNEKDLSDLSLDPIPILLHCGLSGIQSKQDLLKLEQWRRLDKAFANQIGNFHERVLASINGWHKPKTGFDLRNDDKKIVIEIKNKHNTLNSDSAKQAYEKCADFLKSYPDWTVYLAQIVPRKGLINKPWKIKGREANEKIRQIDGATLYDLVTGETDALSKVYKQLPDMMKTLNFPLSEEGSEWFTQLYQQLYR